MSTQKNQFAQQLAQQLQMQKEQLESTSGLKEKELTQQRDQFGSTLGLKEKEMANQSSQYEKSLSAQQSQFSAQLGQQKAQFDQDYTLKLQDFNQRQTQTIKQLEMAQQTLDMQKKQFAESSAAQKEQFGEQMKYQIAESEKKMAMFWTQLEENKRQFGQNYDLALKQMEAQLASAEAQRQQDSGGGCCIIVTVASNPTMKYVDGEGRDSYAVNVTRIYRDNIMPPGQLRGYYMIAEALVPRMLESDRWMQWAKRNIVDNVVPYCEWKTGLSVKRPLIKTIIKAKAFLWLCSCAGATRPSFTRCNGEVF
jgi:hypothetical protein